MEIEANHNNQINELTYLTKESVNLSTNSLKNLFKYEMKKKVEVNLTLQILSLIKMDNQKNEIFTAVLSDSNNKYKNFVLKKLGNHPSFNNYQIIKVVSLFSTVIKTEKYHVFVISEYELLGNYDGLIGTPLSFTNDELANICGSGNETENCVVGEDVKGDNKNTRESKNVNDREVGKDDNIVKDGKENNPFPAYKGNSTFHNKFTSSTIKPNQVNIPSISHKEAEARTKIFNHEHFVPNPNINMKEIISLSTPLSQLSTYTKDLCVVVRAIKVSEMKSFYTNKGQGCLFTFTVLDKEGTEMQVACFNKTAEKFHQRVIQAKVYVIKGGYVKVNDKKFNNTKSNFKIVLEDKSIVEQIEDTGEIKLYSLEVIKLKDVLNLPVGAFVDTLGVVVELHDPINKTTKNGANFSMRKLYVVDDSLFKIELSLWKANAELPIKQYDVILGKNLKIGDFNGRNLATFEDSQIHINPQNCIEADQLKARITSHKGEFSTMTATGRQTSVLTPNCIIKKIKEVSDSLDKYFYNGSPGGEEPITQIKAVVTGFHKSDRYVYMGCPDSNCKKKLQEKSINFKGYRCTSCDVFYDTPAYYFNISVVLKDCSGDFWVDVFGNLGDKLLGITAEQYKHIYDTGNDDKMNALINKVDFKSFIFQLKPKVTNYNNALKKKFQLVNIDNITFKSDFNRMLKSLES